MATFNPGEWFIKSVESIRAQTFENWRLIIVDDGSAKEYKPLIEGVVKLDERIQLITHEKNYGGGAARNTALEACTSDYVAFCDSDDIWPAGKLEKQIRFMKKNHAKMSHGDLKNFYEIPEDIYDLDQKELEKRLSQELVTLHSFLKNPNLFFSSIVIRRDVIGTARFGNMKARHPFRFWCMVLSSGVTSIKCPDCFYFYYVRKGSVSSSKLKMVYYTMLAYFKYAPSLSLAIIGLISRAKVFILTLGARWHMKTGRKN